MGHELHHETVMCKNAFVEFYKITAGGGQRNEMMASVGLIVHRNLSVFVDKHR